MMKRVCCVAAGIFLGCATASPNPKSAESASTAQATQSAALQDGAQATSDQAKKDPNKVLICETYKSTGSHLTKKVCRTKAQAENERRGAEKMMQDADRARPGDGNN